MNFPNIFRFSLGVLLFIGLSVQGGYSLRPYRVEAIHQHGIGNACSQEETSDLSVEGQMALAIDGGVILMDIVDIA